MLIFLKLGGSLITDKNQPHTPRIDVIHRLAEEIAASFRENPAIQCVIGHGSGSFGHHEGEKYGTRYGVRTTAQWLGFAEVWYSARSLNQIVVESLISSGLPVISFPPSSSVIAGDGKINSWDLTPIRSALAGGLVPLVFGDVVFDSHRGGTILSTEDLFVYLAKNLQPARILLAGIEKGVWEDFPTCSQLISHITPETYLQLCGQVTGSVSTDVTGGMAEKVKLLTEMVELIPGLQACIFSGEISGQVSRALAGSNFGTFFSQ